MEAGSGIEKRQHAPRGVDADPSTNGDLPDGIGGMVLGLIESSESGRASLKEIIFAVTGEETIPRGLFEDIRDELTSFHAKGKILGENGKYYLPDDGSVAQRSSTAPSRRKRSKKQKKAQREKAANLERMMAEELGKPTQAQRGRKRRANKRVKRLTPGPTKKR